jgi:hypothetical protein
MLYARAAAPNGGFLFAMPLSGPIIGTSVRF